LEAAGHNLEHGGGCGGHLFPYGFWGFKWSSAT
jgi:hypothetical protein